MSAPFTAAANTGATEMELILSIVQEELVRSGKLLPTVRDFSASVEKGVKSIEIPRFDSHFANPAAQNPDGATATAFQTVNFDVDVLPLDKWVTLPYAIPDRVSMQTRIQLEAELAASAGKTFGRYMDDEIIAKLRLAADGSGTLPNHVQNFSGQDGKIEIADIAKARMLLNRAHVSEQDRYLLISPEQESKMLSIPNFIRADQYGAREALLDGEIGRVMGFRVMAHTGLLATEAIAYQKQAVGYAVQKGIKYETKRDDLRLQRDQVAFSAGWGTVLLERGVKQVHLSETSGE
jgi:N4-gp56 family major capsid protein